jgi:thymidylate synthase
VMGEFLDTEHELGSLFLAEGIAVQTGRWQAQDITESPSMRPIELPSWPITVKLQMPQTIQGMQDEVQPNMPWAEEHFLERVSRVPHNPPPSHVRWPFARRANTDHTDDQEMFSHTYPERFWPKQAGSWGEKMSRDNEELYGIRHPYGDLDDVVRMLDKDLYTRQAFLPVFFPEDTGKTDVRIPCTVGYQFLVRQDKMHCIYTIRSCDFLRHFRDDVYMAMRLAYWVKQGVKLSLDMGTLTMVIGSFHVFEGDIPLMRKRYS